MCTEYMYVYFVQSVNMYCSICKLLFVCFLHCLEHALKNFTHQGTCAVVIVTIKVIDLI